MSQKIYRIPVASGSREPVLVDGVRTPFVKSFGVFEDYNTLGLFSSAIEALVRRNDFDPMLIDEIIGGTVIPAPQNPNVARDAIINLGLPDHIGGYTLTRACASSLQAIADAAKSIAFGSGQAFIAGGVECLSDVPIVYSREARKFLLSLNKAKSASAKLGLLSKFSAKAWLPRPPGLTEPLTGFSMGEHGEMMAKLNGITREAQDAFALRSHQRAARAQSSGFFEQEIIPVWPAPSYRTCIDKDNIVRHDTTVEALSTLRPAFDKKYGTITAGNASPLTDGAAATLIFDRKTAESAGLKPKARIRDMVFVGVQPNPQLLIGPAIAIPLLLKKNGLGIRDIKRFEIHEAFAAQVLSCTQAMASKDFMNQHFGDSSGFGEVPDEILNVNGGAIAIGHPFGATGARMAITLSHELQRAGGGLGVIAICAAGGLAGAMLLESLA